MTHPSREALVEFSEGRLAPESARDVASHLDSCASCRSTLDQTEDGPTLAEAPGTAERRAARAERRLRPGQLVDRYVVVSTLGEGGMGAVYLAYDPTLDRRVALKLVLPSRDDSAGAARLEREARALAQVQHPNAVAVYDAGRVGDEVFIAMERVEGQTLAEWMRPGRPWREVVKVMHQAGRGLRAVHRAGLVHRDFKPQNVVVTPTGEARVLDFGLARTQSRHAVEASVPGSEGGPMPLDVELTEAGAVPGTMGYLAPELFDGGAATPASDQFAFGVTLFTALYGRRPFDGRSPAASRQLPSLQPTDLTVAPWLWPIVTRCLAPRPEERFASMTEVLAALGNDPTRRWRRVGLGVGVVAVLALLAWALQPPPPPPCVSAASRQAAMWPTEERAAFRQRLLTQSPDAVVRIDRAMSRLDARLATWAEGSAAACEAERRAPGRETERATQCFDREGQLLHVYLAALEDIDAESVSHVQNPLNGILRGAGCERNGQPLPVFPEFDLVADGGLEVVLRRKLLSARIYSSIERIERSTALAQEVTDLAADAGLGGFEAEGLYWLASGHGWRGDAVEASTGYQRAFDAALASGNDVLAFDACLHTAGWLIDRAEVGAAPERMARVCRALWSRLGEDLWHLAELLQLEAYLAGSRGQLMTALSKQRERAEAVRTVLGDDSPEYIEALGRVAHASWNVGQIQTSNQLEGEVYRRLVALDPDSRDRAFFGGTLSAGLLEECRFEEARTIAADSLAHARQSLDPQSRVLGELLLSSSYAWEVDDRERALQFAEEALAFNERNELGPRRRASALRARAWALTELGRPKEALRDCAQAVELLAPLGDPPAMDLRTRLVCEAYALSVFDPGAALPLWAQLESLEPPPSSPRARGEQRFARAKALHAVGQNPGLAKHLGRMARDDFASMPLCTRELKEVDAWLASW